MQRNASSAPNAATLGRYCSIQVRDVAISRTTRRRTKIDLNSDDLKDAGLVHFTNVRFGACGTILSLPRQRSASRPTCRCRSGSSTSRIATALGWRPSLPPIRRTAGRSAICQFSADAANVGYRRFERGTALPLPGCLPSLLHPLHIDLMLHSVTPKQLSAGSTMLSPFGRS